MVGLGRGRRAARSIRAGVAAAWLLGLLAAGPAQARFIGVSEAPAGNSADPAVPGRDLTAAGIAYERTTGTLSGAIRLAGPPTTEETLFTVFAGTRSGPACNAYPAVGVSGYTSAGDGRWSLFTSASTGGNPAGPSGPVPIDGSGEAIQQFSIQDDQLKGLRPNCAIAALSDPVNSAVIYDSIGPLDLQMTAEIATKFLSVPKRFATGRSRTVNV